MGERRAWAGERDIENDSHSSHLWVWVLIGPKWIWKENIWAWAFDKENKREKKMREIGLGWALKMRKNN